MQLSYINDVIPKNYPIHPVHYFEYLIKVWPILECFNRINHLFIDTKFKAFYKYENRI